MSQLILTAHSGSHDASAALFENYNLLAAIQLERLTRYKCDGREHPDVAIDEVLSGKTRKNVDVAGFSRTEFPVKMHRPRYNECWKARCCIRLAGFWNALRLGAAVFGPVYGLLLAAIWLQTSSYTL